MWEVNAKAEGQGKKRTRVNARRRKTPGGETGSLYQTGVVYSARTQVHNIDRRKCTEFMVLHDASFNRIKHP